MPHIRSKSHKFVLSSSSERKTTSIWFRCDNVIWLTFLRYSEQNPIKELKGVPNPLPVWMFALPERTKFGQKFYGHVISLQAVLKQEFVTQWLWKWELRDVRVSWYPSIAAYGQKCKASPFTVWHAKERYTLTFYEFYLFLPVPDLKSLRLV